MSDVRRLFRSLIPAFALILVLGTASAAAQSFAELYEAAKKEGSVIILGPPNVDLRNQLVDGFTKAYPGIAVEFSGMPGNRIAAKMSAEARAGVDATDIVISGVSTGNRLLKPAGLLQPLPPLMIPEIAKQASQWRGGDFTWGDNDKTVLLLVASSRLSVQINTDLVKPGEMTSDQDLLNPKWKGKIIALTPMGTGGGSVEMRRVYELHGEDHVRKLVKDQELVFAQDERQMADALVRGQYAIAFGLSGATAEFMLKRGVKNLKPIGSRDWKDPLLFSPGFGCLMVAAKPAHPAAAKLYVNWQLTRDASLAFSKGIDFASLRRDVSDAHVAEFNRIFDDIKYLPGYTEEYTASPNVQKVQNFLKGLGVN